MLLQAVLFSTYIYGTICNNIVL